MINHATQLSDSRMLSRRTQAVRAQGRVALFAVLSTLACIHNLGAQSDTERGGTSSLISESDISLEHFTTNAIQPSKESNSESDPDFIRPRRQGDPLVYGVKNGLHIAIHPFGLDKREQGGPRGLIRLGYSEGERNYLINYIAIEPLVGRSQGFSELEIGEDGKPGKQFWIGKNQTDGGIHVAGDVSGHIEESPLGRRLSFVIFVEPFKNGARPVVEVSLWSKHPNRIRFRTFSAMDGNKMFRCVLTATMGNQSRCRTLWLRSSPISAQGLYEGYRGADFVEKQPYGLSELFQTASGDVVAAISPNEIEPREVWPLPNDAWHHDGKWMTQYWLKPKGTFDQSLQCRVNGRFKYWGGQTSIPGGLSFENFEMREDFRQGQEVWFGYSPESPKKSFGFPYDASPQLESRSITLTETLAISDAMKNSRAIANTDFRAGMDGWILEGGASGFRLFDLGNDRAITTFGEKKDADSGRMFQCFKVSATARELTFQLHGGASLKTHVALWRGERLWRRMSARDDNTAFRASWDVSKLRGQVVTLEIVDESSSPWGFIGVHGITILND